MSQNEEMDCTGSNYLKVQSIIRSIDNVLQIDAGYKLIELLYKQEEDALDYFLLVSILKAKERTLLS